MPYFVVTGRKDLYIIIKVLNALECKKRKLIWALTGKEGQTKLI